MEKESYTLVGIGVLLLGLASLAILEPQPFTLNFNGEYEQNGSYIASFSYNGTPNSTTVLGVYPFEDSLFKMAPRYSIRLNGYSRDISSLSSESPSSRIVVDPSHPPDTLGVLDQSYTWSQLPASALKNVTNRAILVTEPVSLYNITATQFDIISNKPFAGYIVANGQVLGIGGS